MTVGQAAAGRSRPLVAAAIVYTIVFAPLTPLLIFVSPMAVMLGDTCVSWRTGTAIYLFLAWPYVLIGVGIHTWWAWWKRYDAQAWLALLVPPIWLGAAFASATWHYQSC
jgi:hypothetical protein